jgi:hypothetical protein
MEYSKNDYASGSEISSLRRVSNALKFQVIAQHNEILLRIHTQVL